MARVLVVDDDASFATALGRIIRELGHTFELASDGREGLVKFQDGAYDLVITDLKMPHLGGVEFIREIKRIDRDAVVMVITGYSNLESAVETLTLGAYDYVEKPVSIEKFQAALNRGLEKRRSVAQLNFSKGMIWTAVISIPLWMIIGILLSFLLKR